MDPNHLEIVFTYGSEKEEWIKEVTETFNRENRKIASNKIIHITALPMGSGECIDEILNGTRQTHLVSPASGAFIKLANAKSRVKTGKDLIGSTENLVISPVVIAMWKPMAEALGWGKKPLGWSDILDRARDPKGWSSLGQPQWGQFKFGHTHPEFSNSGLISLFAEVYAGAGKKNNLTLADLKNPAVAKYLADIEKSVVHYGSSTGFFGKKMFANGPNYLSAAVLYENMVIESYSDKYAGKLPFPIVAIYPKEGTFWSDHPVGLVERDWVTPDHREAAKIYVDYLLAKPQQEKALPHGFRPSAVDVALTSPIDTAHGVDPKEPQTTLEVPEPEVMDAIVQLWRQHKKHSNVTLVLDVSGSMQEENRMENAREGALQLLSILSDDDSFSLLPFNDRPLWAAQNIPLKQSRADIEIKIKSLYAGGGTALYDATLEAFREQMNQRNANEGRISAIVVLTDGDDTNSSTKLETLLSQITSDNEIKNIRIFTIAYGSGARKDILKQIADRTQAKSYEGTPQNIRSVFRDISTFF